MLRWQLLLAIAGAGLVLSLLSFQYQAGEGCSTRVPAAGGTLVEGVVGLPAQLNPLLAAANPVDLQLSNLIFEGLTGYDANGLLQPALARSWRVSEDMRRFSFTLRQDALWHDGEQVTAEDVLFTYRLLQEEEFPAPEALRTLWQSVTITQTGRFGVDFGLPQPYGPFLDAVTLGILPAHVFGDATPAEVAAHRFNRQPIGAGPFLVVPGSDWGDSGVLRLAPNPNSWPEGTRLAELEYRFFPDYGALAAAFERGEIQAIFSAPSAELPALALLPGVRLFSSGAPELTQLYFNLSESGSPLARGLDGRRAIAAGLDREALVDQALNGQGLLLEGPYLPDSWAFAPGLAAAYGYDPAAARALLDAAGWTLTDGGRVRQNGDQRAELRLLANNSPAHQALAAVVSDQLAEIGVVVSVEAVEWDAYRAALAGREFDLALVDVAGARDPDLYDFWSQEAIVRGHNYAAWNNRAASEALEAGRKLVAVEARRPYYHTFQRLFGEQLPALTLYQHVQTYALSEEVEGAEVGPVREARNRYAGLAGWFIGYRDVPAACAPAAAGE
ncbi:MAG: peptide ABC transporter substrate-binding protein [Candidatus Promineifilaceae bacterium]